VTGKWTNGGWLFLELHELSDPTYDVVTAERLDGEVESIWRS
jgi:hypothetical protein